ncbi:RNA methyltransferase [Saccharophagus sp. K07]|jgi:TfoX/Sxy family transcriptional regulator of competence genes|uniref:TfoX/Sxy family protein n=1 Tax=Saccharophagus sp. K07 TaxID=2283636 RepID=UPI0016522070|nr:TfoX/Sxy family protein [Saccharophagus sp. K07]MBC6905514.1 RNA methyltransferase [Saccharophagus sp. K07]
MIYDEQLAERIRRYFSNHDGVVEKQMFGGLAFLVDGHMCVGTNGRRLMARVGPRHYERALKEMYTSIMDFTGKPLKGFVYVEPEAITSDSSLHKWIRHCEHFVRSLPPKGD